MDEIDSKQFIQLLLYLSDVFERKKDYLTELDSAIGDGDLGISMTLGFRAIDNLSKEIANQAIPYILKQCGLAFSNNAPSTIGALFATGFLRAGSALEGTTEIGCPEIIQGVEAAIDGIQQRGKAALGDKTLLDAIIPALEAAKNQETRDISILLRIIAEASDLGAQSTKDMKSARGRSRWLQERSIGHLDPGAVVVAIIFKSCSEWVDQKTKS